RVRLHRPVIVALEAVPARVRRQQIPNALAGKAKVGGGDRFLAANRGIDPDHLVGERAEPCEFRVFCRELQHVEVAPDAPEMLLVLATLVLEKRAMQLLQRAGHDTEPLARLEGSGRYHHGGGLRRSSRCQEGMVVSEYVAPRVPGSTLNAVS